MPRRTSGFTLVEVMISLAIFTIIAAVLFTILIRNQQSARVTTNLVEAQQNARVAVDILSRDVRMAGYGIDVMNYQPVVQYAGPFEVMFNSNMQPYPDDTDPRGDPQALDWTSTTNRPPHSLRSATDPHDTTGAETIVYTLDANEDGDINDLDVGEAEGNEQARASYNPYDMMLIRRVYGYVLGENTVISDELALVRGPLPADSVIEPLFLYWLDTDRDGIADSLYGDSDNSGDLDEGEIAALGALVWPDSAATLRQIGRITVTAIGEMPEKDKNYKDNLGYRQVRVSSEVTIPKTFVIERREIAGTVFRDCGGTLTGLQGWRVELSPAIHDISANDGTYSFEVAPGAYQVELKEVLYPWSFTTGGSVLVVDVTDASVADADYFIDSPYGTVYGSIFFDIDRDKAWTDGLDSFITETPGDTAALGWGIQMFGPVGGGNTGITDTFFRAPPESEYVFYQFAWRDSLWYRFDITTFSNDDSLNPYVYIANDSLQMPNECDFDFRHNIPLIKVSVVPECSLAPLTAYVQGGRVMDISWELRDPDTPFDSLESTLEYSLDAGASWDILRYSIGPDTTWWVDSLGDSVAMSEFKWFAPYIAMFPDYDLLFRVAVNDPDTLNDTCWSYSDAMTIGYSFIEHEGLYILRDRVPGTRGQDRTPPIGDTIHIEGLQVMPRILMSDSLYMPDGQVVWHDDVYEEDTAMAVTDTAGVFDLVVFWQQDTVAAESLTGDTTPVYSDSARWITFYADPINDEMEAGLWRFYLWGNYESDADCDIIFVAEIYCSDDEGNTDDSLLVFSTDSPLGVSSNNLVKSPGRDQIELKYTTFEDITDCDRLMLRVKAKRVDDLEDEARVYLYYNGVLSCFVLTPVREDL